MTNVRKRTVVRLALTAGVVLAAWPVRGIAAETYYVAKHGSNSTGNGSQSAPWATIQYAVTNVQSGDAIWIGAGTYAENVLLSDAIHTLTIKGGHNTNDWAWTPHLSPTVITGTSGTRIALGGNTAVPPAGSPSVSNTIMGLTIVGFQYGIVSPYHGSAKSAVTISHCVITNQGSGFGIYGYGACDFNIFNTVVAKADMGIYHNGGAGITGTNYIFNCTFVTNRRGNVWMNQSGNTIVSNTISHGSWRDTEGYGIRAQNASHPISIGHSLVYGNTCNIDGFVTMGAGMITNQAPVFENYAGGNYRLVYESPGMDSGVFIAAIADDLDRVARPQGAGYDMGAYEYLFVATEPPAAPTGLTATAISKSRMALRWTANSTNAIIFKIERKTGTDGIFQQIDTVPANSTNYQSVGLSPLVEYFYRVRATNTGGDSDYSNEAGATTQDGRRFVAVHGHNDNGGTLDAPWATIQHAVANVESDDTILVGAGLYPETVRYSNAFHNVTLIGGHNTNDWSWNPTLHPTVIKPAAEVGILFAKGWEYGAGYDSSPSTNPVVRGFTISGGQFGIGIPWCNQVNPVSHVTISHCIITNQSIQSIRVDGAGVIDLRNTLIAGANGTGLYGVTGPGADVTHRIYNCTFVTNRRANIWFAQVNSGHIDIRNTIIHGAWGAGGDGQEGYGVATHTNFNQSASVSYSLLYNNTVPLYGANIDLGAGMITDRSPVFEDAAAGNFRLEKGSPGLSVGIAIPSLTDDLDLNPRPMGGGYDMGAYELYVPEPPVSLLMFR